MPTGVMSTPSAVEDIHMVNLAALGDGQCPIPEDSMSKHERRVAEQVMMVKDTNGLRVYNPYDIRRVNNCMVECYREGKRPCYEPGLVTTRDIPAGTAIVRFITNSYLIFSSEDARTAFIETDDTDRFSLTAAVDVLTGTACRRLGAGTVLCPGICSRRPQSGCRCEFGPLSLL